MIFKVSNGNLSPASYLLISPLLLITLAKSTVIIPFSLKFNLSTLPVTFKNNQLFNPFLGAAVAFSAVLPHQLLSIANFALLPTVENTSPNDEDFSLLPKKIEFVAVSTHFFITKATLPDCAKLSINTEDEIVIG